jgi:hypothetical protein
VGETPSMNRVSGSEMNMGERLLFLLEFTPDHDTSGSSTGLGSQIIQSTTYSMSSTGSPFEIFNLLPYPKDIFESRPSTTRNR